MTERRPAAPSSLRQLPLFLTTVTLALGALRTGWAQDGSPAGPVPTELLQQRRETLAGQMRNGIAVLLAQRERVNDPPTSDYPQDSDYREDNDFFYLTGIETPGAVLVLVAREGRLADTRLFLRPRDSGREQWTGVRLGPGEAASRLTGIPVEQLAALETLPDHLGRMFGGDSPDAARLFIKREERTLRAPLLTELSNRPGVEILDLLGLLARQRGVKDADELRRLRRAIDISSAGHVEAIRLARPGRYEYELEAVAEYTFRRLGAERLGYPSIVGTGTNATTLHYDKSRAELAAGDLVVMDMGAEFGYYTADITRTIPASGTFNPRQRALYLLVLGAQQAAIEAVRPGVTFRQLTAIARDYLREHSGNLCGERSCEGYFIHGLSHHIGMDVHDVAGPGPLQAGMVFTIEPGIYLPSEGLGIRIEDDILVTDSGYEILSAGVPRDVEGLERLMSERPSRQ